MRDALVSGTSNRYSDPHFFCIIAYKHLLVKTRFAGFAKAQTLKAEDMKKYLLSMLLTLFIALEAVAQEGYVVLNGTTLTFYYDNLKNSRQGTKYRLNNNSSDPGWLSNNKNITKVVFDPSFANERPHSTFMWFHGASNLITIEGLKYLNTSNVNNMYSMFSQCSSLTSIDVSGFNTSNVVAMHAMFYGCSSLTCLDLSSFNTHSVGNMTSMFNRCSNLTTIFCGDGWNTDNVKYNSNNMFSGCINIIGEAGTTYSPSHTDKEYARVDGGISNPGYLSYKTILNGLSINLIDNTDLLENHNGETDDVTLEFEIPSNKWITLCLPFDATEELTQTAFGDDVDIEELSSSVYNDETKLLTLTFTPCTSIVAGRPYVVKVSKTKTTPIFYGVTIDKTDPTTIHTDYCSMTGIYNATPLTAGDKSTLFIQNNKFYDPSTAGLLPATKCYFTLTNGAEQARGIGMQFWDEDDAVTAIHDANMTSADSDAWYTSQGIRVSSPAGKGLFIHGGKKVFVGNWK